MKFIPIESNVIYVNQPYLKDNNIYSGPDCYSDTVLQFGGWNAYTAVCQDAQGWLREGPMDELFPMMYFQGNQFFPFVADWKEQHELRKAA